MTNRPSKCIIQDNGGQNKGAKVVATIPTAISKMEVADVGKVLLMFESANLAHVSINEPDLDSVVFLLQVESLIPFDYAFKSNPLPRSARLHEDVYDLIQTRYLAKSSPIYITEQGTRWVNELLQHHQYTLDLLEPIAEQLKGLVGGGGDALFRLVYTAITR